MRNRKQRRGSVMVEFSLAGIAFMVWLIATVQISMAMWNYHTLAYAVHEATRFVAVKGVDCTKAGNTCSITVGDIAQKLKTLAIGVPAGQVNVTLTTDSGVQTSCSPLSSCFSNGAVWPPAAANDNHAGKLITISARYYAPTALLYIWAGGGSGRIGSVTLPATSTQTILF